VAQTPTSVSFQRHLRTTGATGGAPEVWLLREQHLGGTPRTKYFLADLPATASVKQLLRPAHQRWAMKQRYRQLKTELGFDNFEGPSYPDWQRHVLLTDAVYTFSSGSGNASVPTRR